MVVRRLAALAAVLALLLGNAGVCAGWQPTHETRMACCMSDTNCPMHKAEAHDHFVQGGLSQTQADSCCAVSTQGRESSSAPATFASSLVSPLPPAPLFSVPTTIRDTHKWRALVPFPLSSVRKHLLLSVLLV